MNKIGRYAVIYKFKNDQKVNIYELNTKKDAEVMAIQIWNNDQIEYVNISDCAVL